MKTRISTVMKRFTKVLEDTGMRHLCRDICKGYCCSGCYEDSKSSCAITGEHAACNFFICSCVKNSSQNNHAAMKFSDAFYEIMHVLLALDRKFNVYFGGTKEQHDVIGKIMIDKHIADSFIKHGRTMLKSAVPAYIAETEAESNGFSFQGLRVIKYLDNLTEGGKQ